MFKYGEKFETWQSKEHLVVFFFTVKKSFNVEPNILLTVDSQVIVYTLIRLMVNTNEVLLSTIYEL